MSWFISTHQQPGILYKQVVDTMNGDDSGNVTRKPTPSETIRQAVSFFIPFPAWCFVEQYSLQEGPQIFPDPVFHNSCL